jgi:hypothetical protein
MRTFTTDWILAFTIMIAAISVSFAAFFWYSQRQLRRRQAGLEADLLRLKREVEAATGISVRVGERLRKAEAQAKAAGERLGQLELRGEGRPYDQAIDLARRGAGVDNLIRNFGLSRGEADLVALLHGRRS